MNQSHIMKEFIWLRVPVIYLRIVYYVSQSNSYAAHISWFTVQIRTVTIPLFQSRTFVKKKTSDASEFLFPQTGTKDFF
jgi:hypothetical protein